jgi:hypothetical protein
MYGILLNSGQFIIKKEIIDMIDYNNENSLKFKDGKLFLKVYSKFYKNVFIEIEHENNEIIINNSLFYRFSFDSCKFEYKENYTEEFDMLKYISELFEISEIAYINFSEYEESYSKSTNEGIIYKTLDKKLIYNKYFFENDIEDMIDYTKVDYLEKNEVIELNNYFHKYKQEDFYQIFQKILKKEFKINSELKLTTSY